VHVRRLEDLRSTDTDFAGADAAERVRRLVAAAEQRVLLRAAAP
jgi:hypothetical protein